MIYPIRAYGDPVLRKECEEIDENYPKLKELIADMYETMYASHGVGLAAPQIGVPIRLFVIDSSGIDEKNPVKKTFINAYIVEEEGKEWTYEEGCLSIPASREDVIRLDKIKVEYHDENFNLKEEEFTGIIARIIQHEHDHTDGVMFVDYLSPLKKRLIKNKLAAISKGKVEIDYKMKFPLKK